MVDTPSGIRRWAATALLTSLLAGAACSADVPDAPPPSPPVTTPVVTGTPAPGPTETPTSTLPPPATTPVPQPSPGDATSTVATEPQETRDPVDLDEPEETGGGITAQVTDVRAVRAEARGPGEVSGPAVALTIKITNGAEERLSLEQVVVTLTGSDDAPGTPMSGSPARPLSGSLAQGRSARGVYVFALPEDDRDPITVDVTVTGGDTVLVFQGAA